MEPTPPKVETPEAPSLSARKLVAGMLVVGGFAIAGIAIAIAGRGGLEAFENARPPSFGYLGLALFLGIFDIFIGAARIHNLARVFSKEVGLMDCVRAELANRCVSGITPWQTGGGGAQIYLLARSGVPVAGSLAVGSLNFVVSTIVLVAFGMTSLAFLSGSLPSWLQLSTRATLILLFVVLVGAGVVLSIGHREDDATVPPGAGRIRRGLVWCWNLIHRSLAMAKSLLREHRGQVLMAFPITMLIFATKITYTWAVFRAFQPEGHLNELFGVLVILILSLFFAPTPGASGVAEGTATAYLVGPLGQPASVGFVLYWRLISLYLPVVVGGVVLLHQLSRDSRKLKEAAPRRAS